MQDMTAFAAKIGGLQSRAITKAFLTTFQGQDPDRADSDSNPALNEANLSPKESPSTSNPPKQSRNASPK